MRTIEAVAVPVADTKDIVNARREATAVPRLSVPLQETVKAEMTKRRKGAQREAATKCRDNSPLHSHACRVSSRLSSSLAHADERLT
jgi:hypothetical protein